MEYRPYWLATAEPFAGGAPEPPSGRCDIAIVGGGLNGLAAALTFARQGADVALFEKETVGSSASGRNGGMCTTGMSIGYLTGVKRYGASTAKRYFHAYCDAIDTVERIVREEQIDCSFRRWGKLNLAAKPAHYETLARTHEALAAEGYETKLIPKARIGEEVGTDHYHGGMADPRGAGLHVGRFVQGVARAAHRYGARIYEHAEVTGLSRLSGYKHRINTTQGAVEADRVLLASGSTTGRAFGFFRRRFIPVGSYIVVTEPLGEDVATALMPTRRMASDSRNLLYYFRITPGDNRLLFGGRARFSASDPRQDRVSARILDKGMRTVFPQLKDTRIDYAWGGLVDLTQDRMPRAGERDGLFYSMGYSGHGVQMSTHMGTLMPRVMEGEASANIWHDLDWPAIPGYSGNPWFLPAVGAYYRLVDALK